MSKPIIHHKLMQSVGANESTEVSLVADTNTGETQLVLTRTLTERYPITEYSNVARMYDLLKNSNVGLDEVIQQTLSQTDQAK